MGAQKLMLQVSELPNSLQELGANFDVGEIPADLRAEADEWHEKLVETAIEVDDAAMEAFFEGEVSAPEMCRTLYVPAREACVRLHKMPGPVCCFTIPAGISRVDAAQQLSPSTGLRAELVMLAVAR